jgi:hypothetical protein
MPATGLCSEQEAPDGMPCDDGDLCTVDDACQAGVCVAGAPITCTATDQCHTAGACEPATGLCDDPEAADGTSCDDANLCTQTDSCQAGVCTGSDAITCSASDQCHTAGACDPATGLCDDPAAADGTPCDDGDLCTLSDSCQVGVCAGADPVTCVASDQCHTAGICNPASGMCDNPARADGSVCDDGDLCTQNDSCLAGACVGPDPITCTATDQCHTAGTCAPATGLCDGPAVADGTACDDGDVCTLDDTCLAGVCAGGTSITCAASDQCHAAGTCDPATGLCDDPAAADGTSCDDGNLCTLDDTCLAGVCAGGTSITCAANDQCHTAGTCDPVTGLCDDPAAADGTSCDDGNLCTLDDTCLAGTCAGGSPVVCTSDNPCQETGACDPTTGLCSTFDAPDGTVLSFAPGADAHTDIDMRTVNFGASPELLVDGKPGRRAYMRFAVAGIDGRPIQSAVLRLQVSDDSSAGSDLGGEIRAVSDNTWDELTLTHDNRPAMSETVLASTGEVFPSQIVEFDVTQAILGDGLYSFGVEPTSNNLATYLSREAAAGQPELILFVGGACDDGNACTLLDVCEDGVCVGTEPVSCTSTDQCHGAVCDTESGACISPALADGTVCDDGDLCTTLDMCTGGVCSGESVVCAPEGDCHDGGVCDPATGMCTGGELPDGTACDDGDLCTVDDICLDGTCVGGEAVVCASDQCNDGGICDPATGLCAGAPVADGAPCDDGNACTLIDVCNGGTCMGTAPVSCVASDACHDAGICNPASGLCSTPPAADGTPCDDGNPCTQTDACQAGACVGSTPITCSASGQCRAAGTCNPATGLCNDPAAADGTPCDDGNLCTQQDTCQAGACNGAIPVTCTASDQCHAAGTCNPATGLCNDPAAADGTPCDDGNLCTQQDTCQAGACNGANPVTCTASDQCQTAGTCDPATGQCSTPPAANGTACDDGAFCTVNDSCQGGICQGLTRDCATASDSCTAGVCDEKADACVGAPKSDGTACDDGAFCTVNDSCKAGTCQGAARICTPSAAVCVESVCDETTETCTTRPMSDGDACDDGNACTRSDTCSDGACVGDTPVVCTARDQCHAAGRCDPFTGECSNPPKADGTTCDDNDACSADDFCVAGECLGESLPDTDGDGFCDALDLCPDIPDPTQTDADGDGIGDVCQCTSPAPGNCIAGGGSKRTDCLMEFATGGPLEFNKRGNKIKGLLRCADGDPACDLDRTRDGQCTFGVALCFANADPRYTGCEPSPVRSLEVLKPNPARSLSVSGRANAQRLESTLAAVGLEIRRRGRVVASEQTPMGGNQCTSRIKLMVPAGHALGKGTPFKQKYLVQAQATNNKRDKDKFTLICE